MLHNFFFVFLSPISANVQPNCACTILLLLGEAPCQELLVMPKEMAHLTSSQHFIIFNALDVAFRK